MAGSPPNTPPAPIPIPSHPSHAELIESHLRPWVVSGIKAGEFIHEADPYSVDPDILTGRFPSATAGDGREAWYFLTKLRYRDHAKKRVKRTVDTKEGTWVGPKPLLPVRSGGDGEGPQEGLRGTFDFKRMVINKQVNSGWDMVELRLDAVDMNALCKVYCNTKGKADDEASAWAGVAVPGPGEDDEEIDEEAAAAEGSGLKRKAGDKDSGAETAAASSPGGKRAAVGESAGAATTGELGVDWNASLDAAEEVEAPAEPEEASKPKYRKFF